MKKVLLAVACTVTTSAFAQQINKPALDSLFLSLHQQKIGQEVFLFSRMEKKFILILTEIVTMKVILSIIKTQNLGLVPSQRLSQLL